MPYKVLGSLLSNFTSNLLTPPHPNWSHFVSLNMPSMCVINCWTTNYLKIDWLKINLSRTLSVGQESRYGLVGLCFSVSHRLQSSQDYRHLKAQLVKGVLPSSLTWLLTGFSPSQATGLTASVPHWMWAKGHCSLPCRPLQYNSLLQSKQLKIARERMVSRHKSGSYNLISKVTSHHFAIQGKGIM